MLITNSSPLAHFALNLKKDFFSQCVVYLGFLTTESYFLDCSVYSNLPVHGLYLPSGILPLWRHGYVYLETKMYMKYNQEKEQDGILEAYSD